MTTEQTPAQRLVGDIAPKLAELTPITDPNRPTASEYVCAGQQPFSRRTRTSTKDGETAR